MIEKEYNYFLLICDICSEPAEDFFETFDDAVAGKRKARWSSQKKEGKWQDVCPSCYGKQESEDW